MRRVRAAAAVSLALTLAACGGSSKSTSSTRSAPASPAKPTSSVTTGPVRGTLTGANHAPKINAPWPYTVTATDPTGHPLDGTVTIEFTFAGQVVGRDTPPTHPLKRGRWHDNLKFPPPSLGEPIAVQAVVHTRAGSITLSWPITPTR